MRSRIWLPVLLLFVMYAVILTIVNPNPRATADVTPGSSESAEPMGSLALARLWARLGLPFETFAEVPAVLPKTNASVFVSVEPQKGVYTNSDAADLLDFAASGHSVVWVTNHSDAVTDALHITFAPSGSHSALGASTLPGTPGTSSSSSSINPLGWAKPLSGTADKSAVHSVMVVHRPTSATSSSPMRTFSRLNFSLTSTLVGNGLNAATERLVTDNGETVGAVFARGQGQVVVWSAPELFENQAIGEAGNFQIPWYFFGSKGVLWDEYGHRVVQQGLWATLFGHGREGTLLLLLAAVLAFVLSGNTRFGPVRGPRDQLPRLDLEFVEALGWHFSRRTLSKQREQLLDGAVRRRLCTLYGLPKSASWDVLDSAVLPTLPQKLQQSYAVWRTRETESMEELNRRDSRQRLTALAELLHGAIGPEPLEKNQESGQA